MPLVAAAEPMWRGFTVIKHITAISRHVGDAAWRQPIPLENIILPCTQWIDYSVRGPKSLLIMHAPDSFVHACWSTWRALCLCKVWSGMHQTRAHPVISAQYAVQCTWDARGIWRGGATFCPHCSGLCMSAERVGLPGTPKSRRAWDLARWARVSCTPRGNFRKRVARWVDQ